MADLLWDLAMRLEGVVWQIASEIGDEALRLALMRCNMFGCVDILHRYWRRWGSWEFFARV